MAGLEGLRVIELGEGVSAAYATKLMGDLGADVVKVESPEGDRARLRGPFPPGAEGDPEQSGVFLYLNTSKRGIVLDLATPEGRARLDDLVDGADLLVHNLAPPRMDALGIDYAALAARRPALVMCSVTPFGLTGPYRDWKAEEITIAHAGGWAWLSPGASPHPEKPPLKAWGHQAEFQAGLAAAAASLAASYRARRTGEGEHIDLSAMGYVASLLEQALVHFTYGGEVASRLGRRGLNPWGIYECRDGLVFVCTIEEDQWQRLVTFMGEPEWASLEIFEGFGARLQNADALRIFLQEWMADWKVDDLWHEAQKQRICFAPVLTMEQMARQPHLQERGFFADVTHRKAGLLTLLGAPYRLKEPWWEIRRPAPLLDEHADELRAGFGATQRPPRRPAPDPVAGGSGLPLEGVRVLDFSWVWAGPFGAMQLAHLGAEVIKVESQGRPDLGRRLPIFPPDVAPSLDASGYFNQWNQGKKSIRLNLGHPAAADLVKRLVAQCDVVVENFATGVLERLGLGYESLCESRPDLVMASISGYGHSGPLREYIAYGPAVSPLSGLSSLSGYEDGPACEVGISLGDPTAGINAAVAICAALVARQETGRGQHIDVSLWESTAALVGEGWMEHVMRGAQPPRMANRDPHMAPHGVYRCVGEDAWVSIACSDEPAWSALCTAIDPALAGDERFASAALRKRNEDALDERIEAWTAGRDRFEVSRTLQEAGVAAFPSMTPEDLASCPHLEARGFFARLEHPIVGARQHAGIPWLLERGRNGVRAPAPVLGADTEEVLGALCDLSAQEIAAMTEDGLLY